MNLREGSKNILLQDCYKIFPFVTAWSRVSRPRPRGSISSLGIKLDLFADDFALGE
jgi:hypothetical protein